MTFGEAGCKNETFKTETGRCERTPYRSARNGCCIVGPRPTTYYEPSITANRLE